MRPPYILLLVLLYGCYLVVGALVFHLLEHKHEETMCQEILEELERYNMSSKTRYKKRSLKRSNLVNSLVELKEYKWSDKNLYERKSLKRLVQLILLAQSSGVQFDSNLTASCAHNWNFYNSFFFAGTVITTIGYGNIAPSTWSGRSFCMCFAIIGLPLFGIMFREIGSLFASFFRHFEYKLRGKMSERLRHCCILLALLTTLIIFFLIIPAFIFVAVEEWEYQEALYYSFITLTTIGFGDYVAGINPDMTYNSLYRIAVYFWVLFGLAFMAAVVNVMSDVIQGKAKRSLKEETDSRRGGKSTDQSSPVIDD